MFWIWEVLIVSGIGLSLMIVMIVGYIWIMEKLRMFNIKYSRDSEW